MCFGKFCSYLSFTEQDTTVKLVVEAPYDFPELKLHSSSMSWSKFCLPTFISWSFLYSFLFSWYMMIMNHSSFRYGSYCFICFHMVFLRAEEDQGCGCQGKTRWNWCYVLSRLRILNTWCRRSILMVWNIGWQQFWDDRGTGESKGRSVVSDVGATWNKKILALLNGCCLMYCATHVIVIIRHMVENIS